MDLYQHELKIFNNCRNNGLIPKSSYYSNSKLRQLCEIMSTAIEMIDRADKEFRKLYEEEFKDDDNNDLKGDQ